MRHLVVANWKMNMTGTQANAFLDDFLKEELPDGIDVAIAPPFTALAQVNWRLGQSSIALAGQNMSCEQSGAFTGEISAPMLTDAGCTYVILGHSERRQLFGETDADVNNKTRASLSNGLTPIVCVGETGDERDAGEALTRVISQARAALDGLGRDGAAKVVMAYEPIWAIGTGKNCDADDADAVMGAVRASVDGLQNVRILYGGSMKPENVRAYACMPNINGGLVGGASLDPAGFAALIRAASQESQSA
ncbi:MAG: triose-phosphate isomerase [Candidatus Eremiobacteraeota bacterium]|nr:triose-phosphate isomerase [Candidatus Eremiobacteraeota bacterium]